jgi:hypothetical protein
MMSPNSKIPKISKIERFSRLIGFQDAPRIVDLISFVKDHPEYKLGNGGSWCRRDSCKQFKVATMKANGKINILWDYSDPDFEIVQNEFSSQECILSNKGNYIKYIGIFGKKIPNLERPIREDIKAHYKKMPCCVCGSSSDLVCDHKNDLYNDQRVLSRTEQTLDDFQSLCNHCNLQKRQVAKECRRTGKRYPATKIPSLKPWNVDFIEGNDDYDPSDINAMKGTFWYDPIAFHTYLSTLFVSENSTVTTKIHTDTNVDTNVERINSRC